MHATFFVLGSRAAAAPALVREIADAGHEIAVHGWTHRPLPLRGPRATYEDLTRAIGTIADLAGQAPRLFRPPYGVMSAAAHLACRRLGLTPVLWTAWGRDWSCHAAPGQVHDTVMSDLHGDGTILLHDSDCTSAPASWRSALGALPALLDTCQVQGWKVGPLRDHGIRPYAPTR
ncbi:polysaccharide deacetylase family protein [Streptacidiphilus carbonis]|uniref:polysaccharide deacetylase family protein n=1 Tax=Streptacidiphilus carbonis TaxID=105422 RepID=UPI000AC373CA|nr:polysaccharide deacetylase family protein [Streptacidiphilus carbonis]